MKNQRVSYIIFLEWSTELQFSHDHRLVQQMGVYYKIGVFFDDSNRSCFPTEKLV